MFFHGKSRWIVDLPGYGFATGQPRNARVGADDQRLSDGAQTLRMVFVLVDAEVGPTKLDLQTLDWLRSMDLPFRIVATKADQVKPSKALKQRTDVAAVLSILPGDMAWVSAAKGTGIPELRFEVAGLLDL